MSMIESSQSDEMRKAIFLYLLLAFPSLSLFSCSKPCTLSKSQIPEIRGFKIDLTIGDLKQRLANLSSVTVNKYGYAMLVIDKSDPPDQIPDIHRPSFGNSFQPERKVTETYVCGKPDQNLNGVERIYLEMIDEKIVSLKLVYSADLKWNSVDEFVEKSAQALGINATWENINGDYKRLMCADALILQVGIARDHLNPRSEDKLPFVEVIAFMDRFKATSRRLDDEENQKKSEQEKKNTFRP